MSPLQNECLVSINNEVGEDGNRDYVKQIKDARDGPEADSHM